MQCGQRAPPLWRSAWQRCRCCWAREACSSLARSRTARPPRPCHVPLRHRGHRPDRLLRRPAAGAIAAHSRPSPSTARTRSLRGRAAALPRQRRRHRHRPDHRADVAAGSRREDDLGRGRGRRATASDSAGYDDWRAADDQGAVLADRLQRYRPGADDRRQLRLPFIDTDYFDFAYGDESAGERIIDSQYVERPSTSARRWAAADTMFGVNFADGRIKGYPTGRPPGRRARRSSSVYVRGNPDYGNNDFADNGDGTITDRATGLMWKQDDSGDGAELGGGAGLRARALEYLAATTTGGCRTPRSCRASSTTPRVAATDRPARRPSIPCSSTHDRDRGGRTGLRIYWTGPRTRGGRGAGRTWPSAGRWATCSGRWHGRPRRRRPAQRPQERRPRRLPATGSGPQGDAIRIFNYVRCVRAGS